MDPLPIDPVIPDIVSLVAERRAVVVVAPPGAGKTTRIPPALVASGPLILLQPRRVAARSLARRIALEQGWTVGREVGWQVRFERQFCRDTRLLVATEGILTARLQADPLLGDFRTVVLDEFHERSLHGDLGLALSRQAAAARDDLRLVVMSATLDAGRVAAFLGGCPVIEVPGRPHPVEVEHAPRLAVPEAALVALSRGSGGVLCFLPGAGEIRRASEALSGRAGGIEVLPLHGSLPAEEQDRALAPGPRRKLVLATNIAETSLTVEGVTDVVDSGLHKVLRYDATKGIDRLETERIPCDSAEQRAGRAGRTGPGRALRLWDPGERLRPEREPEVRRVDLAATVLDVMAWGGDPGSFEWYEAPPPEALERALELLGRLGAVEGRRLTAVGEKLRRLPLHPRLGRVLLEAGGGKAAAAACAVLSERDSWSPQGEVETTDSDILLRMDGLARAPARLRHAARELARVAERVLGQPEPERGDDRLLRALLAGYPDRVARRRSPGSPRLVLASGHGAVLGSRSGVREAEYLVALDVRAGRRGAGSEAVVSLASRIDREWLQPGGRELVHRYDAASRSVRAVEQLRYGTLVLEERPAVADPNEAGAMLLEVLRREGLDPRSVRLLRRLRVAGVVVDLEAVREELCAGRTSLPRLDLAARLSRDERRQLERLAPDRLAVPSGREVRLDYREDGEVVLAVKLQELFGLAESPGLGPDRRPVTLELLAPSGRPVQTTRDLRSFWERTYPEVRKELRGRYPKHPWPEDPWSAQPTARTRRRH